jgi:hypothetical protein
LKKPGFLTLTNGLGLPYNFRVKKIYQNKVRAGGLFMSKPANTGFASQEAI